MKSNAEKMFFYPQEGIEDEEREMARVARQWAEKEIILNRLEYQKNYRTLWMEKSGKLELDIGFQRLMFPEQYGGSGFTTADRAPALLTALSEVGRADAGIGYNLALLYAMSAGFAMEPYVNAGLCDIIAPVFCGNERRAASILLPGMGICQGEEEGGTSDPLFRGRSIRARIAPRQDSFLLTGEKLRPLGNGANADVYCVVCADPEGKVAVAYVRGDAKGIQKSEEIKKTGLEACMNADVTFNGTVVPEKQVVFGEGIVLNLYSWFNLLAGAVSMGAAINFYELLSDWADNRTIKGGTVMKNNALCAAVLADVAEEITIARLLSHKLALFLAAQKEGEIVYTMAQMIGRRIQTGAIRALNRGMELMGSAGYAKEWHVEKHWRDIKTIQSYLCGVGAEVPVKMDIARLFFESEEI